jgi:hypothetical protein
MVSNSRSIKLVTNFVGFIGVLLIACSLALSVGLGCVSNAQSLDRQLSSAANFSPIVAGGPRTASLPATYGGSVVGYDLGQIALTNWQVAPDLPDLQTFIEFLYNGDSEVIRGVFIEDVLALPVIQQPEDNLNYVSDRLGVLTQFQMAAEFGVTGLLAHNHLSGKEFFMLQPGQEVWIIYGDKSLKTYQVSEIATFQKLSPYASQSDYIDLSTDLKLSTPEMFRRFYRNEGLLIFQTCMERDGSSNWGLLFVTAIPVEETSTQ